MIQNLRHDIYSYLFGSLIKSGIDKCSYFIYSDPKILLCHPAAAIDPPAEAAVVIVKIQSDFANLFQSLFCLWHD